MVQETKLASFDDHSMGKEFPEFHIYRSNLSRNKGGVLTFVRKTLFKLFTVEEILMPEAARGRVLAHKFTSKEFPDDPRAHYNIANVYFTSGMSFMTEKKEQIEALMELDPTIRTIVGGDFNFVESDADCTGDIANCRLTGAAEVAWGRVKVRLNLNEGQQGSHTRFGVSNKRPSSARLDRFYTSLSEGEKALSEQHTYPIVAGGFWCRDHVTLHDRLERGELVPLVTNLSDHLPLALDIFQKSKPKGGVADVPAWAATVPGFGRAVAVKFGARRTGHTAYQELDRWKAAVRSTHKQMIKGKAKLADTHGGQVAKLTAAIGFLRLCSAATINAAAVREAEEEHGYLKGLATRRRVDSSAMDTTLLENFIDGIYGEGLKEVATAQQPSLVPDHPDAFLPGAQSGENFMADLKTRLPGDKSRLTALRSNTAHLATAEPVELDKVVTSYYGRLWAAEDEGAEDDEIGEYLRDYNKQVHGVGGVPSTDDVIKVTNNTNDSCAGPDGIPFALYRMDVSGGGPVASLLQEVIADLSGGGVGPAAFNKARLFLIAKTSSLLVQDTRPISVTDAANRIVASCLAEAVTPALQEFLEGTQKGFCPGRVGTDHVHSLTQEFYSSLSRKRQMYLLSLDTARAFDSISHRFIKKLLPHVGMPEWVCNLVAALLNEVTVVAAMVGAAASPIAIKRGVKQGCPFSPLLFILCFDVLLWRLDKISQLKAYAYADDLALTTVSSRKLVKALELIREFSKMSGLGLNEKKTVIVSTKQLSNRVRRVLDANGWKAIHSASHCVYLGVAVGPRVTTKQVFTKAMTKFTARLNRYSPFLKESSLHTRIVVANVFLLPLLYYLAQFYIAPRKSVIDVVRRALHTATVAFHGTAFGYAHLRGWSGGPSQGPVVDEHLYASRNLQSGGE